MAWWAWIILGAGLLAAEILLSTDFYLVFFGLAALLIGLLALLGLDLPAVAQWLVWAGLASGALVLYRQKVRSRFLTSDRELAPELVGEEGVAREPLAVGERGRVELRGTVWEARNDADVDIAVGARCVVARVEGLTLFVRPPG
jgi:membrane protein implicated in regulation of membrane protease activity